MAVEWTLAPGDVIRRSTLHDIFGGGRRGGMEPSGQTPNVFLFTSQKVGKEHGYEFDGWDPSDGTFRYTGEGPFGDQVMTHGNKAVRDHLEDGRALRLFEKRGTDVVYMGEFEVPNESHVLVEDSMDAKQELPRRVFVFRLRPVGQVWAGTGHQAPSFELTEEVPLEAMNVERYVRERSEFEPVEALRVEADLVRRFALWLDQRHLSSVRNRIATPGGQSMYTDVFIIETQELIEAKASSSRQHIRMALGQILDYARHVDHMRLAVLTPTRPTQEMQALLIAHGVGSIWETERRGNFESIAPNALPTP